MWPSVLFYFSGSLLYFLEIIDNFRAGTTHGVSCCKKWQTLSLISSACLDEVAINSVESVLWSWLQTSNNQQVWADNANAAEVFNFLSSSLKLWSREVFHLCMDGKWEQDVILTEMTALKLPWNSWVTRNKAAFTLDGWDLRYAAPISLGICQDLFSNDLTNGISGVVRKKNKMSFRITKSNGNWKKLQKNVAVMSVWNYLMPIKWTISNCRVWVTQNKSLGTGGTKSGFKFDTQALENLSDHSLESLVQHFVTTQKKLELLGTEKKP